MSDMNYRSNSHKSKTAQSEVPEKRVEKITSGVVTTQKKSGVSKVADVFVSEDINSVKSYVVSDVIIPAVKKLVYDIITDGVDMILYGESGRNRRGDNRGGGNKISYSNFYDQRDRNRFSSDDPRSISRIDYEDLVFASRGDAENVRIGMIESIERYGYVTIADMYDMAGKTAPYTAQKYGWMNVSSASVVRVRDGYKLKLPKACHID